MLSILIPTYNREKELRKNLHELCAMINTFDLYQKVEIIISDNGSNDYTLDTIQEIVKSNPKVNIHLNVNAKNFGAKYNVLKVLELSHAGYVMYLGDDDYISSDYLLEVIHTIENNPNITCIISSYQNILPSGEKIDRQRDVGKPSKIYKKGFSNCLCNSWRGHQLSGLVFKREGLLEEYVQCNADNLYPFIFFVVVNTFKGDTYHLTRYPILVSRPSQSKKDWGYGDDGLISDVFENYKKSNRLTLVQKFLLEVKFLDCQYWRYAMYLKLGISKFIKCLISIMKSNNTSLLTKLLLPLLIFFILSKKFLILVFSGKLFSTLKTKVEI